MRIYKREDGDRVSWAVDYHFGGKRYRLHAGSSEKSAKALRLRVETEINSGTHDPAALVKSLRGESPSSASMESMIDAFLVGYRSKGGTDHYLNMSKSWKGYFTMPVAAVTQRTVEAYRDHLIDQKYGDSTVRKYVGGVGTLFKWAIKNDYSATNPAHGVTRPEEPDREVQPLSREDQVKVLAVATDPAGRLLIELLIASGMRLSEALTLRWSQVDRAGGSILIHKSKTGKARSIPLNTTLTGILDRATRHVRSDFVLSDREGKALDRFIMSRVVESALQASGIVKIAGTSFNRFRHTFGSRLAEAGVGFGVIAQIMGNSAAVAERHYIRFSPAHTKAAMALLDGTPVARKPNSSAGKESQKQREVAVA